MTRPGERVTLLEVAHDIPVARVQATFRAGSGLDTLGHEGVARMAGELLRRGAGGRSRAELDEALDRLGADLGAAVDVESVTLIGHVLARNLGPLLEIFEAVLLRPDFPPEEVEKLRREMCAALDEVREDDAELCNRFFRRALYGEHPYGRPQGGTQESLTAITRDELLGFHASGFVRDNGFFGASGDLDERRLGARLDALVTRLRVASPPSTVPLPDTTPAPGRRVLVIDKPERTQAQILLGHPAVRWGEPDDYALRVAVTAFGGTFTSPLMTEVRVKRGLSYGAYAHLVHGRGRGHLQGWVFPAATQVVETLAIVLGLWEGLGEGAVSDEQIAFARDHLCGRFPLTIDTPERRLALRASLEACGLPQDYLQTYPSRIRGMGADEIRAAVRRRVTPSDMVITIVATAADVCPLLERAAAPLKLSSVDVVPFDSF